MVSQNKVALACMAHPDDVEFTCGGTLALLHQQGWEIHMATMTPGDCGSDQLGREEISRIRRVEAAQAAAVLEGTYHCLECPDGFIMYDPPTVAAAVKLVREVRPALVFAASPQDYLIDHEVASALVRNAAFFAGVPNLQTEPFGAFRPVPYLYYADAMEGKDLLGLPLDPTTIIDTSAVIETKVRMLACHASQRDWLLKQHGMDEYTESMRTMGRRRGELIGAAYAEWFRQHLGHGYPQDNRLARELGRLVHVRPLRSAAL